MPAHPPTGLLTLSKGSRNNVSQWYFAYGSNLSIDQMIERVGPIPQGENRPRIARLHNYRLIFNMRDDGGSTYANIQTPGDGVLGVIYSCCLEALSKLDKFEEGYNRHRVVVATENGDELQAFAYIAKPTNTANGCKPSADYLHRIVTGARQHGLPEAYIREIEAIAAANIQ